MTDLLQEQHNTISVENEHTSSSKWSSMGNISSNHSYIVSLSLFLVAFIFDRALDLLFCVLKMLGLAHTLFLLLRGKLPLITYCCPSLVRVILP